MVENRLPRLLIVDDDSATLQLLVDIIQGLGIPLITASSGREAQGLLRDYPLDMAIVDLRLPDISGVRVLEQMRKTNPDSIRLLMTAFCDFESAATAVNKVGIYHILIKPIEAGYLTSVLNNALQHLETERERSRLEGRLLQVNRRLTAELKRRTRDARKFHEELIHTRQELERTFWEMVHFSRFSSLGLMMGVLAHDMRNPLTVLSGQLQILSMKTTQEEGLINRYAVMTRQVERIQELVEGVSRLGQGDLKSERLFHPGEALKEALTLTKKLFATKEVEVLYEQRSESLKVRGNFGHWVHIFFKLLEFIGHCSSNCQISIQVRKEKEAAEITVKYPASNIPARIKRALTSQGLPAEPDHDQEETSFYLCARILAQYGGHLRLTQKGEETIFRITQPLAEELTQPDHGARELEHTLL